MDFRTIYYVGEGFQRGAVRAKEIDHVGGDNSIPLTSGTWVSPVPLRFRQYEGTKFLDYVGTQWTNIKFLSDRAIDALRTSNATGWVTYPVGLEAKSGSPIMGYHGLIVRGRCGPIDNARSVEVDTIVPGSAKRHAPMWKGMYFREDSWDGSDVFRPEDTGYIFVTQRVRDRL
jgi:hypothetical protein